MGRARPAHVQDGRAARRAARRPRARRLGARRSATSSSSTASPPEKITVTPHGVDPAFTPGGERATAATCSSSARSRRARTRSPRSPPRTAVGLPLVVAGPEKEPALARRAARTAAPTCAATSSKDELAELYRGAAALVLPSRFEGFGAARCSRRWRAARRSSLADEPALREVAGDAGVYAEDGDFAAALRARARRARAAASPPGSSARRRFSWAETARRTADVYRQVLA